MAKSLRGKVLAWLVSMLGLMMLMWGMFGVSDTDRQLRREIRALEMIAKHHESGLSEEILADDYEELERVRAGYQPRLHSESAVLNVMMMLVGSLLCIQPWRDPRGRREGAGDRDST